MPPKPTFSRTKALEAGLNVTRTGGLANLSARNVAQLLGCSTQPVYRLFGSMGELQEAVIDEILKLAMTYLTDNYGDDIPPLLQVGLGSLHFAQDEPELANILAVSGPVLVDIRSNRPPPPFVLELMHADPFLQGLNDLQLTRIHTQLWFFSQGLSSLFREKEECKTEVMEQAREQLQRAAEAFIRFEQEKDSK